MAKSAYERMFDDGTAFKPIKINQPSPDNEAGRFGMGGDTENLNPNLLEQNTDNDMEDVIERAKRLKAERTGQPVLNETLRPTSPYASPDNKKVKELERRISMLEQALQLVMETQTKLLKEGN